jgi:hypothetical protein
MLLNFCAQIRVWSEVIFSLVSSSVVRRRIEFLGEKGTARLSHSDESGDNLFCCCYLLHSSIQPGGGRQGRPLLKKARPQQD